MKNKFPPLSVISSVRLRFYSTVTSCFVFIAIDFYSGGMCLLRPIYGKRFRSYLIHELWGHQSGVELWYLHRASQCVIGDIAPDIQRSHQYHWCFSCILPYLKKFPYYSTSHINTTYRLLHRKTAIFFVQLAHKATKALWYVTVCHGRYELKAWLAHFTHIYAIISAALAKHFVARSK